MDKCPMTASPLVRLCMNPTPAEALEAVISSVSGSPSGHDRRTCRSGLGEILRARGLPRNDDALSAREWAKGVWLCEVAQQGASSRTPALAGTALAGTWDHPCLLEFRSLGDVFA
jgi:hypothetical protein